MKAKKTKKKGWLWKGGGEALDKQFVKIAFFAKREEQNKREALIPQREREKEEEEKSETVRVRAKKLRSGGGGVTER